MSTTTLNLETIELVSTLRTAPLNGSPSSQNYNDCEREQLTDLASITSFLNDVIRPLLNTLPNTAMLPTTSPVGIEGRTVNCDTSDQSSLFYNSSTSTPLSIADSLRVLQGMLTTFSTTLNNQTVQVAALQSRLSTTNQNDVSLALQSFSATLSSITSTLQTLKTQVSVLESLEGAGSTTTVVVGNAVVPVIYAPTLVFNCSASVALITFELELTGDVTSSSLINTTQGELVTFIIQQDEVGGRSFVWPSNVLNPNTVSSGPNTITSQSFVVGAVGNLYPTAPNTSSTNTTSTKSISSNYSVLTTDDILFCTAGSAGITLLLPDATLFSNRSFTFKQIDAGTGGVTITTTNSQTIDGDSNYELVNQNQFVELLSDGSNWQIIGAN